MTHFISSNFACNLFVKACQMEKTSGLIPSNTGVVTIFEEKYLGHFCKRVLSHKTNIFGSDSNPISPNVINFMNDTNLRPGDECEEPLPCTWHTRIENIVYHSRDWASPGTVRKFLWRTFLCVVYWP